MDIAFPVLLIFLLIGPGFVFREFSQRREVRAAEVTPFSRASFAALLYAAMINALACLLVNALGYKVHLYHFYLLLAQSAAMAEHLQFIWQHTLQNFSMEIALYFSGIWLGSYMLAWGALFTIKRFNFERAGSPLTAISRGNAPWFYLLNGLDHCDPVDGTLVAASVDLGGQAYLFRGLLTGVEFGEDGQIDRIVITGASRRLLTQDKLPEEQDNATQFYDIDGDRLVLKFTQISTLNVVYLTL